MIVDFTPRVWVTFHRVVAKLCYSIDRSSSIEPWNPSSGLRLETKVEKRFWHDILFSFVDCVILGWFVTFLPLEISSAYVISNVDWMSSEKTENRADAVSRSSPIARDIKRFYSEFVFVCVRISTTILSARSDSVLHNLRKQSILEPYT